MFVYGPKHAKKLPYYDTFPLVLPLERYSDGFLGMNFHYLPIPLRMRLLDRMFDFLLVMMRKILMREHK